MIDEIIFILEKNADIKQAHKMSAYMQDKFKFVGKSQGKYRFTPSTLLNTPSAPR